MRPARLDRESGRRVLPFAAAGSIGVASAAIPPTPDVASAFGAAALLAVLAVCAVAFAWARPPAPLSVILPLAFLVVVGLLGEAHGGSGTGFAPLAMLSVFWVALYGTRWQLAMTVAGVGVFFALPPTGVLGPDYATSDVRYAVLWVVVSALVGFTVQSLVNRERRQRTAVAEQKDFLDAMFSAAGSLVAVLESDGRVRHINPACERVGGYTEVEMVGRPFWELLVSPEVAPLVAGRWAKDGPAALAGVRETAMVSRDGSSHRIHWTLSPLHDPRGNVIAMVATGLDVTDERASQEALAESEYRFRTLLANLPETVVSLYDRDMRCLTVEGPVLAEQGLRAEEFEGLRLREVLPRDSAEALEGPMRRALIGENVSLEYQSHRNDTFYEVEMVPYKRDGHVLGAFVVSRDVTRRRAAEAEARQAERRLADSFQHAPIGMEMIDLEGRFIGVNPALAKMLMRTQESLIGEETRKITHPEDVQRDDELRASLLRGKADRYDVEKRMIDTEGREVDVAVHLSLVRAEDGEPMYFVGQVLDITERKRFEERLKHLAEHDSLTGLLNRRRFEVELQRHMTHIARYGRVGALLVLDIDKFKSVNDNLGHARGDQLIVAIARTLDEELRATDRIARLGGDEFAILLPEADREEAATVAQKLVDGVHRRRHGVLNRFGRPITVSVGVTAFEDQEHAGGDESLVDADMAMYEAKGRGGNSFCFAGS